MEKSDNPKKHCNLYYIYEQDKKEHPMPEHKVLEIREYLQQRNLSTLPPSK